MVKLYLTFYYKDNINLYQAIYLSIHISSYYLSIYSYIKLLSIYLFVYQAIYLSIRISSYLSIYLSIHISNYLSIYLSIRISSYLSIYLVTGSSPSLTSPEPLTSSVPRRTSSGNFAALNYHFTILLSLCKKGVQIYKRYPLSIIWTNPFMP